MNPMKARRGLAGCARLLACVASAWMAACGGGDGGRAQGEAQMADAGSRQMPGYSAINGSDGWLDVAINGQGAFVLLDPVSGVKVLSRLGRFGLDANFQVVNQEGWLLLGVGNEQAPGTMADLQPLPRATMSIPATATQNISLEINLDSRSEVTGSPWPAGAPIDLADDSTYNNSTTVPVYDLKGQQAGVSFYFRHVGSGAWEVYVACGNRPVGSDADGRWQPITTLLFRPNGAQVLNPASGRPGLSPIRIDLPNLGPEGTPFAGIEGVMVDLSRFTLYGAPFGPYDLAQDGLPSGWLTSMSVGPMGQLMLNYSNGRSVPHGRLVLARTTVADRVFRYGETGWWCGRGCRPPVVDFPGQSLNGMLHEHMLNEVY